MSFKKWELKEYCGQIADTGDYDGHYEITNGDISLMTKDYDNEGLQEVIDALNKSEIDFYADDADKVTIYCMKYQIEEQQKEIESLKQQLNQL